MLYSRAALLSILLASPAFAADLVPTQFKPFEVDMARPELKLDEVYSYRLGLNFTEGKNYVLHPVRGGVEKSSMVRRELGFGVALPYSLEAGLSLYDTQQGAPYANVVHKKQKLGGAAYLRYHLLKTESVSSSVVLQYEPGTADRNSFHQASQDKTGLAVAVDARFTERLNLGLTLGATRRQEETFRNTRLNDELTYGTRLSYGPRAIRGFVMVEGRSMPFRTMDSKDIETSSVLYQFGFETHYKDLNLQASTFVPTERRYPGIPERGFQIAVQYVFGKGPKTAPVPAAPLAPEPRTLPGTEETAPAPSAPSEDDLNSLIEPVGPEGEMGAMPMIREETKAESMKSEAFEDLNSPEADEFQKWDEVKTKEANAPETATEKAEREYKLQIEKEKAAEALAAKNEAARAAQEENDLARQLREEEIEEKKSARDIERELSEYTLPDNDDVNWNGLNP